MNDDDNEQQTIAKPAFSFTDEQAKNLLAMERRYLRQQRIEKFLELNPVAWFFDEWPPQEMYHSMSFKRSTRQELRHHWLRRRTGWTFLSRLKTSGGVRFAAAAGLVSAVFQAAPDLRVSDAAKEPFKWLLVAGLCYLLAVVCYEIFCPLLLKQVLAPKVTEQGPHWRRWWRALVEDELRRWWQKREWIPRLEQLDVSRSTDLTAATILTSHGIPAFVGFGAHACAHIELALREYATTQKICMWRAPRRHGDKLSEFEPSYMYEGSRPRVQRLHIRRPEQVEMAEHPNASKTDLVIQWYRSDITVSHIEPHQDSLNIEYDAEGLQHLFDTDEHAAAFTTIVAHWQDSLHPWRRLLLLTLYALSVASFAWFAFTQIMTVF